MKTDMDKERLAEVVRKLCKRLYDAGCAADAPWWQRIWAWILLAVLSIGAMLYLSGCSVLPSEMGRDSETGVYYVVRDGVRYEVCLQTDSLRAKKVDRDSGK